jgi:hypothetical protein
MGRLCATMFVSTAGGEAALFGRREGKTTISFLRYYVPDRGNARMTMTVTESRDLKKGTRVYWRGDAADSGIVTETSWDAVTIAWNNGKVASVHHGDMREIQRAATK